MSGFAINVTNLRKKRKFSQAELAKILGVQSQNISKWENGRKMPSLEMIGKLSSVFDVKLEDLLSEEKNNKNIYKIVITGGPCAGKSTAMDLIQKTFTKKGYVVLFIRESATELITSGLNRDVCRNDVDFQASLFQMQRDKENIYYEIAQNIAKKVLIVCDRGLLDGKAFLSEENYQKLLKKVKVNEIEIRDDYDAVFHMVSAAKGAEKFYTLENNSARTETVEEAAIVDDKIISAWTGHPYLKIIDNSTDFEGKIKRLMDEISSFLGEKENRIVEKKYLIEIPNVKELEKMNNCEKVEIIQTYLSASNDEEVRIRQRGKEGNYVYHKTIKKKINETTKIETNKKLTKEEYLNLLMKADPSYNQIRKTRYCLTHDKYYYEIDVYPFWKDKALLEVKIKDDLEKIHFPTFINVLKDVTKEEKYKSCFLAKSSMRFY